MVTRALVFIQAFWLASAYLRESPSRVNRYFTYESTLPPMESIADHGLHGTANITPSSESQDRIIPITYTNDPRSVLDWCDENLYHDSAGILGFDTESIPTHRRQEEQHSSFKSAATVQLATIDSCLVVHLVRGTGGECQSCSPILRSILNDPQYIKAGCAIDEDMMGLFEIWEGLDARSRLDLGFLGKRAPGQRIGLKKLSATVVGLDLPKPRKITLSNWTKVPLSEAQLIYSARDAWVGAAIANELAECEPTIFGRESLINTLEPEVPIAKLVERKRRRDQAKEDLRELLRPYESSLIRQLPKPVKQEAKRLREKIKQRVIEPSLVDFEI